MQPPTQWNGGVGYVSKDMVEKHCPPPADDVKVVPSLSYCEAYFIYNINLFIVVWVFFFGNFSNISSFLARFRLLFSVTYDSAVHILSPSCCCSSESSPHHCPFFLDQVLRFSSEMQFYSSQN